MVGADFAVAPQHDLLVAGKAAAAVIQENRILPVAQHADFRHGGDVVKIPGVTLRLDFGILVTLVLRHLQVNVGFHLRLFLEQGLHGTHDRLLHEELLQAVVAQIIGQ